MKKSKPFQLIKNLKHAFFIFITILYALVNSSPALAITQSDRKSLHAPFYEDCATEQTTPQSSSTTKPSKISSVFMVGDSITNTAKLSTPSAKDVFKDKGINATISGSGGGTVSTAGTNGDAVSGLDAIDKYNNEVKAADAIIVAYGTNNAPPSTLKSDIKKMINKIKSTRQDNNTSTIFWVNTYTRGKSDNSASNKGASIAKNEIINQQANELEFNVIDVTKAGIDLHMSENDYGIHPEYGAKNGIFLWLDTVIDGLSAPTSGSEGSIGSSSCCPNGGGGSSSGTLTGDTPEEQVWNYFKDPKKRLSDEQVAGIMGNISQESGFNPKIIQNPPGGETKDPSTITGTTGWGLIQWSPGNKVIGLARDAKLTGKIYEMSTQLDLVWAHMNNAPVVTQPFSLGEYRSIKDVHEAALYWQVHIEGAGTPNQVDRDSAADLALKKYGGTGGGSSTPTGTSGGGSSVSCAPSCEESSGKTVVIDPGHGPNKTTTDSVTGLTMIESDNQPEGHDVWEVAQKIKSDLSKEGYNIILTKKAENDNVTFRQRANIADSNKAALALSIHGDPGLANPGEVYVQKNGLYRGSGSKKTVFNNDDVAKKSQQYAQIFKQERESAGGGSVVIKDNSLDNRGLEPGNIPMVQLFSKTPWVYNEQKMPFNKDKYVKGLENSIKKVLGSSTSEGGSKSSDASSNCSGAVPGDLQATVKNYAWPEYHASPYAKQKPAYANAVTAAKKKGQYIGGTAYPGNDCGGFVTRAMIDSGYEPRYNFSGDMSKGASLTTVQETWLKDNWQRISVSSTKDLRPGDVAINSGHTFMFVGSIDGFNSNMASASWGGDSGSPGRSPMAGQESAMDSGYNWYRKK